MKHSAPLPPVLAKIYHAAQTGGGLTLSPKEVLRVVVMLEDMDRASIDACYELDQVLSAYGVKRH